MSIAYDGGSHRSRVKRIRDELELTWVMVNGEGRWNSVAAKYLYASFPQYMLLNRDGTLYAGTDDVDHGRKLQALLEEILAAEAAEKEAATAH